VPPAAQRGAVRPSRRSWVTHGATRASCIGSMVCAHRSVLLISPQGALYFLSSLVRSANVRERAQGVNATSATLILLVVATVYFRLMEVRPNAAMSDPELPRPNWAVIGLRAVVSIVPGFVLAAAPHASIPPILAAFALTTLVEPLLFPSPQVDPRVWRLSRATFVTFAALRELDITVKTALTALLFAFLAWIHRLQFIDPRNLLARLARRQIFSTLTNTARLPDGLDLPAWFYATALLVLTVRTLMLFAAPEPNLVRPVIGAFSGLCILTYAYVITGHCPGVSHELYPEVFGVVLGYAFKIFTMGVWASIEAAREGSAA